jgi:hypothetical protein
MAVIAIKMKRRFLFFFRKKSSILFDEKVYRLFVGIVIPYYKFANNPHVSWTLQMFLLDEL